MWAWRGADLGPCWAVFCPWCWTPPPPHLGSVPSTGGSHWAGAEKEAGCHPHLGRLCPGHMPVCPRPASHCCGAWRGAGWGPLAGRGLVDRVWLGLAAIWLGPPCILFLSSWCGLWGPWEPSGPPSGTVGLGYWGRPGLGTEGRGQSLALGPRWSRGVHRRRGHGSESRAGGCL